nr:adenylate/guanylate cyclase domain-containing protein [Lachnospiraceae bacterium]
MEKVNKWNTNKGFPILEMGIGINTGEVILGNMGSEKSMKYGIIGSEVNLCSRIESYTVGGQVLISPKTRDQINYELEIRKEMTVYPKGTNEEVTILHVTGIGEPYNIHISVSDNKMQKLEKPIPVGFHRLDGKHELEKILYGGITAVSREGAMFETDTELAAFENIRIEAGGKLFCKILDKSGSCYTLQYTSIPVGYDNWLNESKGRNR